MDALIAKGNAIQPLSNEKQKKPKAGPSKPPQDDHTLNSVAKRTSLPKSFQNLKTLPDGAVPKHKHIANKKLRAELVRNSEHIATSKALLEDADMLLMEDGGKMEVEGEMERTWRVGQSEIQETAGQEAARGRKEWKLEGGPYRLRYTRNGRHLAIVGKTGHAATFDWQTGTLHTELQLQETCRDITFLHDQSYFAVAQKKYVFIYDRDGVELHCLKAHVEPTRLEFLPYHWLLASVGNPGYLKYQDTSTGQLVASHRTKFGSCTSMTQNLHNAVIHLGHTNGLVTLWTPNLPHPAVQLLAHLGPVSSLSVDPSDGGRYMATAGKDGTVKVWDCRNWKGCLREWVVRGTGEPEVEWSQRGYLGVASGGTVNVYTKPTVTQAHHASSIHQPPLYLTHAIPHRPLASLRFCPYQDILTIGHNAGLSSILVPGAGEPNFDSMEADPFEGKKARREREVRGLLDKVQPDMITLDPESIGNLVPQSKLTTATSSELNSAALGSAKSDVTYARLPRYERLKVSGKADLTEDVESDEEDHSDGGDGKEKDREAREKRKMRGKGKSLKRYLRKQRKNVIDPAAVAIRRKLEKQKEERRIAKMQEIGRMEKPKPSALDRFKRVEKS
ncbi:putative U3 small nucleolar RNA-associated protein 7 [Stygiomarasmius scandens]|uniref:U3 small nucleolar RNA-associated protein 7 n=1 Tax=Marasmiellus scandens TaxID=2682957 RepID=A0ABR1JBG2_9AGAR